MLLSTFITAPGTTRIALVSWDEARRVAQLWAEREAPDASNRACLSTLMDLTEQVERPLRAIEGYILSCISEGAHVAEIVTTLKGLAMANLRPLHPVSAPQALVQTALRTSRRAALFRPVLDGGETLVTAEFVADMLTGGLARCSEDVRARPDALTAQLQTSSAGIAFGSGLSKLGLVPKAVHPWSSGPALPTATSLVEVAAPSTSTRFHLASVLAVQPPPQAKRP